MPAATARNRTATARKYRPKQPTSIRIDVAPPLLSKIKAHCAAVEQKLPGARYTHVAFVTHLVETFFEHPGS